MQRMASMCHLDVWYQLIDIEQIMTMVKRKGEEQQEQPVKDPQGGRVVAIPSYLR
jgi:hypothetical protein